MSINNVLVGEDGKIEIYVLKHKYRDSRISGFFDWYFLGNMYSKITNQSYLRMHIKDLIDLISKAKESVEANKEKLEAYAEALENKINETISGIEKEYEQSFDSIPITTELTLQACKLYDDLQCSIWVCINP